MSFAVGQRTTIKWKLVEAYAAHYGDVARAELRIARLDRARGSATVYFEHPEDPQRLVMAWASDVVRLKSCELCGGTGHTRSRATAKNCPEVSKLKAEEKAVRMKAAAERKATRAAEAKAKRAAAKAAKAAAKAVTP